MGISGGPQIIRDTSLVLALEASDQNSNNRYQGRVWTDLSGNNNSGSIINGPSLNNNSYGSFNFNGINSYISVPYSSNFNAATNGITLNTWVYNTNPSGVWKAVITRNRNGNLGAVYGIWRGASNQWHFRLGGGSSDSTIDISNAVTGSWTNLSLTYDKTTLTAYINGSSVGTNTPIGYINDTQNLLIGDSGANEFFSGSISTVQIYNRALSATEIQFNYNQYKTRFNRTTPNIVTYISLNTTTAIESFNDVLEFSNVLVGSPSFGAANAVALVNETP
jgi:hypothetical protein